MQQELWLWAQSQLLASLNAVCAMRAAASHPLPTPPSQLELKRALSGPDGPGQTHNAPNSPRPGHLRTRTANNTFNNSPVFPQNRENADKNSAGESPWNLHNPVKASRSHQELHRELLLAHKKGLVVCCKPELQMVLERRKREQTQKEEGERDRSPLEQVLLKRQQKHEEVTKEKEQEEKVRQEIQLLEFVRVRQNLRKVHTALHKNISS
ncbi:actin-associated protein FAM107A isoform X1 [Astyanax mexicanus]|uniref:actin-associated protein FAM107A isoform X1 n=1 Tax=Astyanax mexicanus TaxID=7994 RepID=UPI000BBDD2BF|nr:actin-associated protein FAM107A isoform X1 [Astyanax mexicanus]XP_049342234.1 actin-associated protein FAM107A isoform X1 [Astyanax mexicanus]